MTTTCSYEPRSLFSAACTSVLTLQLRSPQSNPAIWPCILIPKSRALGLEFRSGT